VREKIHGGGNISVKNHKIVVPSRPSGVVEEEVYISFADNPKTLLGL